ncbi:MAG: hypothetical protein JNJ57_14645, partial [Saprospiraceae bacterium]|nr:hypothetical protein [Saprospiraceae bacterium]
LLLACAGILCAVGTKGPVGLFPLAVPAAWYFARKQGTFQTSVWRSLWLVSAVVLCWLAILHWNPELQEYHDNYLKTRLLPTLEGVRDEVAAYRFKFLEDLLSQWILAGALSLILWWRCGKEQRSAVQWEPVRYFLLIGLAGTFPLAFSAKQSAHYLAPAMPFFALAFAAFMVQVLPPIKLNDRMSKWFRGAMAVLLFSALLFSISKAGNYARDKAMIEDVKLLIQTVGKNTAIGTSKPFGENWGLIAYLSRLGNVHLEFQPPFNYYLADQQEQPDTLILTQFKQVDLPLRHFKLYENKSK